MGKNDKVPPIKIRWELLYEEAPCGYVSFLNGGLIFNANKTLIDWLGYTKDEIIEKKKIQDFFSISGRIFFETHFFPLIRMQGFVNEIYFDFVKKDGSKLPILINVKEFPEVQGYPYTYHATVFDIRDRKNYEAELLKAKRKAEADSEAKARFLSTVSHEIRTPLNAILGIGNLIHQTPLNEAQKEYARILLLSSENLLNLVNNLLDMSKLEAKKVKIESKPFNIVDLIKVLEQGFEVKADEKNIDLVVTLDEDVPHHLLGDPVKLNQILNNLIGNSIKFTNNGTVMLEVSVKEIEEKKVLLEFKVTDTGIGIPEDKLDAIFQEFSQASYDVSLEFGGTGLGLTICQRLLQLYKSRLHVSSEFGKGSEFRFDIWYKINKEVTPEEKFSPKLLEDHLFDDYKILIVDDNKDNIFIASQYLEQWHVPHDSAENGEDALEKIKENYYDLILMDMQMPKMNGYECSIAIRKLKLLKQPVIIAFSASAKSEILEELINAEIDDHLPKPFNPLELKEMLILHLKDPTFKRDHLLREADEKSLIGSHDELDDGKAFSVDTYEKMANGKTEYFRKFLTSALNAIITYRTEFEQAVSDMNEKELSALIHKSTMTLYYLEADNLSEKLKLCRSIMQGASSQTVTIEESIEDCKSEMDVIRDGLETYIAEEL